MTDQSQPMPWFRLYHEMLDDDKLRLLAFEDRWHYVALLCCKAKGILDADEDWSLFQRRVAVRLGVQSRELEEIHRRLLEVGLVDESMQPTNWHKRQRRSDQDPTRAERQRRHRKKRVSNPLRDGEVTRPEGEEEREGESVSPNGDTAAAGPPSCPQEEIKKIYAEVCVPAGMPAVRVWNEQRQRLLRARWREDSKHQSLDFWRQYLQYAAQSSFLTGKVDPSGDRPPFCADLEWLVRPKNFAKVIEGKYHRE